MTERGGTDGLLDRDRLATLAPGAVLLPGTEDYEARRRPVGRRFSSVRPAAIVRCRTAMDVASALPAAQHAGLALAVRSGGHDFAGRSTTTGVVIDLGGLNGATVEGTRLTVGAGARLGDLHRVLDPHGRAVPTGCGATVGIAGLSLGGGLGILGRSAGLTCDSLVAAEVVLADGRIVRCDEDRHGNLFWALRGGGAAGVGVATELTFETVPAPRCTVFRVRWDWRHAADIADAWQHWAPEAPDTVAASLLLEAPADPAAPPTVTLLGSAAWSTPSRTAALLAELTARVGAEPVEQEHRELAWPDTKPALAALGPGDDDGLLFHRSGFVRGTIPRAGIDALVGDLVAVRTAGEARELDFSPWGGAYDRVPVDATAFPHRRERFLLKHGVTVKEHGVGASGPSEWLRRSWQTVQPQLSGGVYPNFPDPTLADPGRAYWGANLERLRAVKAAYDPEGVLPGAALLGTSSPS